MPCDYSEISKFHSKKIIFLDQSNDMFKSSNFPAICDQLKAAKEFLFKNFDLNEGFENKIEDNKKKKLRRFSKTVSHKSFLR